MGYTPDDDGSKAYRVAQPAVPELPSLKDTAHLYAVEIDDPLTRQELAQLRANGIRYLGIRGQKTLAFAIDADANIEAAQGMLREHAKVRALTPIGIEARTTPEVLAALTSGWGSRRVHILFWPHTPAGEVRKLLGERCASMRLPRDDEAPIREACGARCEIDQGDLYRLLASPFPGRISLPVPPVFQSLESRELARATELESVYGLDGSGEYVGVWDDGTPSHPDLPEITVDEPLASERREQWTPGFVLREDTGAGSHATWVTGVILSNGAGNSDGRGFAPGCTVVSWHASDAPPERRQCRHDFYHSIDNHSYDPPESGADPFEFDIDNRDLNFMAAFAAGNDGAYGTIPSSMSKNVIIVGATDASGTIASFSSKGPLSGNASDRVVPDICAMGAQILMTKLGGGYERTDGTSFASPSVVGMYALLAQLHKQEYSGLPIAADVGKLVLVHTAVDGGTPGPDYAYGFGVADAKAAADVMNADAEHFGTHIVRGYVAHNESREYRIEVPAAASELRVTTHWLDTGVLADQTMLVVNNLDATLIAPDGTVHFPFSLDRADKLAAATTLGPTEDDNIEQFVIQSPAAGHWIIKVEGAQILDPEDVMQGFVIASNHPVTRDVERWVDGQAADDGIEVPDNDASGVSIEFEVTAAAYVTDMHVFLDVLHDQRGDLEVELFAPDGDSVLLETSDSETRQDLCTIYPDLRSREGNVEALKGKPAVGTWRLVVRDLVAGGSGTIRAAALELEYLNVAELRMTPEENLKILPGAQVDFSAELVDVLGKSFAIAPTWSIEPSTGGTITADGLLTAGTVTGDYQVIATDPVTARSTETRFTIRSAKKDKDPEAPALIPLCSLQAGNRSGPVLLFALIVAVFALRVVYRRRKPSPAIQE